ncbi:hypothetical protein ES705_38934 [subsurface metagenome]
MTRKELWDNMMRVVKVNSGQLNPDGSKATEIVDLQIPRGYIARVRKVIFDVRIEEEQLPGMPIAPPSGIIERLNKFFMALVNDPDDEESIAIPTHEIDHDVIADCEFHIERVLTYYTDVTMIPRGGYAFVAPEKIINFDETIDIICPRNIRFNASAVCIGATIKPQVIVTVYFTYEKVTNDLLLELLNIA